MWLADRPWEQVTLAGSGSFSVRETYDHFLLSKSAPAVHLLAVGDSTMRTFGLSIAAFGQTAQEPLPISVSGRMLFSVERHDYRQILLRTAPDKRASVLPMP